MSAAVHVNNATYQYAGVDPQRLEFTDVSIPAGGSAVCVGPSGCGKTTLLHLIAGILVPATGTVRVGDVTVSTQPDAFRRDFRVRTIGLVFQRFELLPYLSVRDNIMLAYHINPSMRATPETESRVDALTGALGIADKLRKRPDQLSQGERQRVAIARAVVTEPELLLCDEPTGNLDPETGARVIDLVLDQANRSGATLLMVTHDHSLLDRFDQVIEFSHGGG